MPTVAKLNYLRIAPRKVRLVADLIRGKKVEEAQSILRYTIKRSGQPILKLLKSALAAAKLNSQLEESNLYIAKIFVDEGPKFKRFFPRSRGQAYPIQKKTSHITIMLEEIEKKAKKKKPKGVKAGEKEKVESTTEKTVKTEKTPKFKAETKILRPRTEKGAARIFRRKSF